jgi:hypothetical protein
VVGVYPVYVAVDELDDGENALAGVLPMDGGSGLGVRLYPAPYGVGGANPGVIGIIVFVGLRGDSGLRSSLNPFK